MNRKRVPLDGMAFRSQKYCMKYLPLFLVLLVSACTVPQNTESSQVSELPAQWPRSPELETSWGKPDIITLLSGERAAEYSVSDHGGSVEIVYEGVEKPREIRSFDGTYAADGVMSIMGQNVAFYGSGNEEAAISTQAVLLTDPSGRKGWYTFNFSAKEHLDGKNIPAFIW